MSEENQEKSDEILRDEMPLPDNITLEDSVCTVFVGDDDKFTGSNTTRQILKTIFTNLNGSEETLDKTLGAKNSTKKSFENSNQSKDDINDRNLRVTNAFEENIQEPPYDPHCFSKFLELSEVHAKCVDTKVRDSVGRDYKIKPKFPIQIDNVKSSDDHSRTITQKDFQKDCKKITDFIDKCNTDFTFHEICHKVSMDKEAIGWGAFEVIRKNNGEIARLQHLPAVRLKVLRGFSGFVEEAPLSESIYDNKKQYTYYQPFGQKVGKYVEDPFDFSENPKSIFKPYDPDEDGDLRIGKRGLEFNLVDKDTGQPLPGRSPKDYQQAANEVLYVTNNHSNSVYYGYSDIVPAIGAILTNVHIRDYLLQFFEHNCIPRYAVIIKGAKIDDDFMKMITDYFENKVKGSAHKTIILALGGFNNRDVEIEFKDLSSSGTKESDFANTRKANDSQIMVAHGTPPAILGISETASLGSGKGMAQSEMYKNRVARPLQRFWSEKLNKLFNLGLGCTKTNLEFDPMDLRDSLQVAQALNLLANLGMVTINEGRTEIGYDGSFQGGDVPFFKSKEGSAIKVEDLLRDLSPQTPQKPEEKPKLGPMTDIETQVRPASDE